ncbi:hypothetical protein [Methylobacterium fujisawaense]|uniref:hypothetical protein n=1 Tax=Methylobacterium fujisawaense TaxID=107400 RepID=UPI002F35ED6D
MTPTAAAAPPGLGTAFATWERLPALAAALGARDAVHLVIDPSEARILSASEAAAGLATVLDGPALADLTRQIATAVAGDAAPRLARLRLDVRRIAPPVLCWLARGAQDDGRRTTAGPRSSSCRPRQWRLAARVRSARSIHRSTRPPGIRWQRGRFPRSRNRLRRRRSGATTASSGASMPRVS